MTSNFTKTFYATCQAIVLLGGLTAMFAAPAFAHHVLGRPAYGLNEDSNTPPSQHAEARVGDFILTYMVFPAFPKPGEPGRIHLYAARVNNGPPLSGTVTFSARQDSWAPWVNAKKVELGRQPIDAAVYRQSYLFKDAGEYIVSAEFVDGGESHTLDFAMRVGPPPLIGPTGLIVGGVVFVLLCVTLLQRRRSMTGKIRNAH
ncbi:MAG: hypothetical protein HOJ06_11130 [Rhodospirillaceae bacterium]|jgi:hypothetical protein|nr:hypothetical protein [Rhodospirillaceae bacterium]MBT5809196.1 hypothetical protein [Rhodospirillaceae bacterium]